MAKVAVVGSREFADMDQVRAFVASLSAGTVLISGGARGVDRVAENEAKRRGLTVQIYPAQWGAFGKRAGFKRNETIVDVADRVVAFWDGQSRGTAHTVETARRKGKPVEVFRAQQRGTTAEIPGTPRGL